MFTCVPIPSVDYYLAGGEGRQLRYYTSEEAETLGTWWTPDYADGVESGAFKDCRDGEAVDPELFVHLCSGTTCDGRTIARADGIRRPGYDLHFAAPKTVSMLALLLSNAGKAVVGCHERAVRRSLRAVHEMGLIETRTGHAGHERSGASLFVAAIFTHSTSRVGDCQLHSHCAVPNTALRSDGTVGAIDNKRLMELQRLVGAIYSAELAHGLLELGYELEQEKKAFKIAGVPDEATALFSKARKEIERLGSERGFDPSVDRKRAQAANLELRPRKAANEHLSVSRKRWVAELNSIGLGTDCLPSPGHANPPQTPDLRRLVAEAVEAAFANDSVLRKPQLLARVAEHLQLSCSADVILRVLADFLPSLIVDLTPSEKSDGAKMFSTHAIMERERQVLKNALEGRDHREFVPAFFVDAAIARRPSLSDEQRDAVRHALNRDRVTVIEGFAGAGKSFTLGTVADAVRSASLEVWVLGPSWSATEVIAKDTQSPGERARALSGWLNDVAAGKIKLGPRCVVILDEAGMVSTEDMSILQAVVAEADCKLILSGDTKQLKPVAAGSPLTFLARALGSSKITEIRRQTQGWNRAASKRFAMGLTDEALHDYDFRGHVQWMNSRSQVIAGVADRYVADVLYDREAKTTPLTSSSLVIASRHEDVRDLNDEIRDRLKAIEVIAPNDVQVEVLVRSDRAKKGKPGKLGIAVGDRIAFGETVKHPARTIRNADVARVMSIGPIGEVTLVFEKDEQVISTRFQDLVGFRADKEPAAPLIRHIYAATTHFSQGMTLDRAYVAAFHAMDRDAVYVAMTRHRHVAQFFVDLGRLGSSKGKSRYGHTTLTSRKQAFLTECLRPSKKLNAIDFIPDLQACLKGPIPIEARNGPGYRYAKPDIEARMRRRVSQNLGEAAILSDTVTPCGMPNLIYNRLKRPTAEGAKRRGAPVSSVRDWLSGLIEKVKELSICLKPAALAEPSEKPKPRFKLRVKIPSQEVPHEKLVETIEPDFP